MFVVERQGKIIFKRIVTNPKIFQHSILGTGYFIVLIIANRIFSPIPLTDFIIIAPIFVLPVLLLLYSTDFFMTNMVEITSDEISFSPAGMSSKETLKFQKLTKIKVKEIQNSKIGTRWHSILYAGSKRLVVYRGDSSQFALLVAEFLERHLDIDREYEPISSREKTFDKITILAISISWWAVITLLFLGILDLLFFVSISVFILSSLLIFFRELII